MARLARAVIPGLPCHVTQRGNRRQKTFFGPEDYLLYLALMAESCHRHGVAIWAYALMPNHSHLVAVPETADALRRAIGEAHRRYTLEVNKREGWTGCLWQGRFFSFVMDEPHTIAAARYIELNPVRAGLAGRADQYAWSSARAHLARQDDALVSVAPLLSRVDDWRAFLCEDAHTAIGDELRKHTTTGRPLGSDEFVSGLERLLGRMLRPRKPGPPRKRGAREAA